MVHENLKEKLDEYANIISEIRVLSAVSIEGISDSKDYASKLQRDFKKIGLLGIKSREILDTYLYPILDSPEHFSHETAIILQDFCNLLLDPPSGDELDLFLLFEISKRLLEELLLLDDYDGYAAQLNMHITVCYANVNRTARLTQAHEINSFYRDEGLKAADEAKRLLKKENFVQLSLVAKKEVIRAVKFYAALYDTFFAEEDTNEIRYKALEDAILLSSDTFYIEQTPGYPWNQHLYRCLEHMGQLTERGNRWHFSTKQCACICEQLKVLEKMWEENTTDVRKKLPESHYRLILLRNRYFAGLLEKDFYQDSLLKLYDEFSNFEYDMYSVQMNLLIPAEYMATLDSENLSDSEIETVSQIYNRVIDYVLKSVNMDAFNYLQEYLIGFLEEFIELPEIMSFETMGLKCLAALHPPTYVHSLQVADITKLLTKYVIADSPSEFIGICDCKDESDVKENEPEILDYAYHCGLCHDFGKIAEIDTIFTYGRSLFDSERDIIKMHTLMGRSYLEKYPSTRAYAKVAENHHRYWSNDQGYPTIPNEKVDTISGILKIADSIDAATDLIGRSYITGKGLRDVMAEIKGDTTGMYIPSAVKVLDNPEVIGQLEYALKEKRLANYKKAYELLKGIDT